MSGPRDRWALCLGGAACVWGDVRALEEEVLGGPWPGIVIACNDAGVDWPRRLDHWVTMHPEKLHVAEPDGSGDWMARRAANDFHGGYTTWGIRSPHLVDRIIKPWGGGSSGFIMLRIADELSCTRAVLCGVPMTYSPHYHSDHQGKPWKHADHHWRSWVRHWHRIDGWVRSMSGRTRETLGAPDMDWLSSGLNERRAA